jgi:TPR repeat protein
MGAVPILGVQTSGSSDGNVTKRRIGIAGIILLIIAIGIWAILPEHGGSSKSEAAVAPKTVAHELPTQPVSARAKPITASGLWTRPTAAGAARNSRRSGFAWILRQLGTTEDQLNRLADLDIAGMLADLKQKAQAGDAASINILGEIALQNCRLGRDQATVESFVATQIRDAQAVPAIDASWFSVVMRDDEAFYKNAHAACAQVDQDQVMSWVKTQADKGDGASLWLMFRDAGSMTEMQQRLREAAAAGFPQAQYELAGAIIAGQTGAAGTGADKVNVGELLQASQNQLATSEQQLALCEYSGCDGIAVDVDAAIMHAREAAQRGSIDAMLAIGPHLPAGQLGPDEVTAWGLVQASLQQQGCGGSGFSVRTMKSITNTLNANNISAQARVLAEQYWQEYGVQMMNNIGCT